MSKIPSGFISLGHAGSCINISCIDQSKCCLERRINKVRIVDKFGVVYHVDPKLVNGKIKYCR